MRWTLVLERKSENALNPDIVKRHLKEIAAAAERNRAFGFKGRVARLGEPEEIAEGQLRKRYLVRLRLEESRARTQETAEERYAHVRAVVEKCARSKGWAVAGAAAGASAVEDGPSAGPRPPFEPIDLTDDVICLRFGDVYEREAHIRLINDAVQTYRATGGEVRAHIVLYGEPGGCKTTLLERLKPLYDDAHERMVFMDASTMTKAGLEQWVLERAEAGCLPEIMCFEEIEKVDNKDNLKCLGSVMASGFIMRTNARIGRVQVPARCLCLATCNDEQALKDFMKGYIWDRFVNQFPCPLPSQEVMYRILLDKIERMPGGRPAWARHAMELAAELGVRTPRKIIGFLAGRSRLEDGSYQRDMIGVTGGLST